MVAKHPNLRIVSVHLASLEWNVDEIAKRLDKFPHLSVDMAARIEHLQNAASTNWQKIHDFFIKYQDRIVYGTDIVESSDSDTSMNSDIHDRWIRDWKFLVTDENLSNSSNKTYKGLKLPRDVVDKIYARNAEKWIPGIVKK
jgi:predicted TIM-barrel fold metal-dependent hydrolase